MLTFPATFAAYEHAAEDFRHELDTQHVTGKTRFDLELVFEEIVTNIIRHGFPNAPPGIVTVSLSRDERRITVLFEDNGQPFDPIGRPDPILPESIDEAIPGGLGLVLVRKVADGIEYEYTAKGTNYLRVVFEEPTGSP